MAESGQSDRIPPQIVPVGLLAEALHSTYSIDCRSHALEECLYRCSKRSPVDFEAWAERTHDFIATTLTSRATSLTSIGTNTSRLASSASTPVSEDSAVAESGQSDRIPRPRTEAGRQMLAALPAYLRKSANRYVLAIEDELSASPEDYVGYQFIEGVEHETVARALIRALRENAAEYARLASLQDKQNQGSDG